MLTLCAVNPPLLSQKFRYGAPGGGSGTGKYDKTLGLAGSATLTRETRLGPSSHPPLGVEQGNFPAWEGQYGVDGKKHMVRRIK